MAKCIFVIPNQIKTQRSSLFLISSTVFIILLMHKNEILNKINIQKQMNSEYSCNSEEQDSMRKGRPLEQVQKFTVDSGCDEIDILIVDYFSKFGIEDGLACEDDEDGPRQLLISRLCAQSWPELSRIFKKSNLSRQDFVFYIDYVSKSADLIFCQELCQLLLAAFLSLDTGRQVKVDEAASRFLEKSEIFSLRKFRQAYEAKDLKKSKRIRKGIEREKKIVEKVKKNLKNEKKKSRKQGGWITLMENMKDAGVVRNQFIILFSDLRQELKRFVEQPQPFLSQLKEMISSLENIVSGI